MGYAGPANLDQVVDDGDRAGEVVHKMDDIPRVRCPAMNVNAWDLGRGSYRRSLPLVVPDDEQAVDIPPAEHGRQVSEAVDNPSGVDNDRRELPLFEHRFCADASGIRNSGNGGYAEGAGTGMIIEPSGVIVTNNHVVAGAQTVTVTFYAQSKQFPARVIGVDAEKDIALVQVEGAGSKLPVVHLGNSDSAQQGDGVLAIGNALALAGGETVTQGIVSALNRSLTATTDEGTTENLTGLIQTDAPINPGNSGGPLVNSSGQVVAMNTAVATSSQGNAPAQNVGFAIAVDEIRTVAGQILRHPVVP